MFPYSHTVMVSYVADKAREYSKENEIILWDKNSATDFIKSLRSPWMMYETEIVIESLIKELIRSYPKTTFNHICDLLDSIGENCLFTSIHLP